jgi:hypothetical protein
MADRYPKVGQCLRICSHHLAVKPSSRTSDRRQLNRFHFPNERIIPMHSLSRITPGKSASRTFPELSEVLSADDEQTGSWFSKHLRNRL